MRKPSIFIAITGLIAALVLFLYALSALPPENPEAKKTDLGSGAAGTTAAGTLTQPKVEFGNPMRGPANAPVTIVVFGDYLCAPCATLDGWLGEITKEFPDSVRVVWKDFPHSTNQLTTGTVAAIAARCAAAYGAFWEYHDRLLAEAQSLDQSTYGRIASELGLDLDSFTRCLNDRSTLPLIERDINEGIGLNIDSTPYAFINSQRMSGAESYVSLHQLVADELAKAPAKTLDFK
ncbi:MAG: thioredoxin domain-containing protein [Patescibacteria group bacterium]|jgi:protein-disulfide isomerase